jgi:hypothetical protein
LPSSSRARATRRWRRAGAACGRQRAKPDPFGYGGRLDPLRLRERALSVDVAARLDATTAEFRALQVTQRPTFVFENGIGDKAVFSGLVRAEPLFATLDAMLVDDAAYAAYRESVGVPPP